MSGNANDLSTNNNNGAVTGATLTADRFGNVNSAYSFNGSSDYIEVVNNASLTFTTAVSFSFWINIPDVSFNTVGLPERAPIGKQRNSNTSGIAFETNDKIGTAGTPQFYLSSGSSPVQYEDATALGLNTWVHLVGTYDGTTLKLYSNNVLIGTSTGSLNLSSITQNLFFGKEGALGRFFKGKLDDIGIWDRALTITEIEHLFNGCSPDVNTGLVALYSFNGNANDLSTNNNNGAVTGATLTADRFGNVNSAYSFNGSSDYIEVVNNASLTFTTAVSFSFWINIPDVSFNTVGLPERAPIGKQRNSNTSGIAFETNDKIGTAGTPQFYLSSGSSPVQYEDATALGLNTWVHLVGTYDGTTLKLYSNNVLIGTSTGSLNLSSITQNLFFGKEGALGRFFKGKLDDIRIYNRAINACDVDSLFNEPNAFSTGITEQTNSNSIKIYPNPSNKNLTIDFGNIGIIEGYELKISNTLGQQVLQQEITQQQFYVDLSTLKSKGIYFVQVLDKQNNIVETKKIILQ